LGWKKSTTYTTIKKLCEKGYIRNGNATVSVLKFLTAFLGGKKISTEEAQKIKKLIDQHRER